MARVAYHPEAFANAPTGKTSKPVKDKPYLEWLHGLPCIVTGRLEVQAAHVSYPAPQYGKLGRGKSTKESDRWAVPLCAEEHALQHTMNERDYWRMRGIDPCVVALAIHGAYPNTGLALLAIKNIERRPGLWQRGQLGMPGNSEGE